MATRINGVVATLPNGKVVTDADKLAGNGGSITAHRDDFGNVYYTDENGVPAAAPDGDTVDGAIKSPTAFDVYTESMKRILTLPVGNPFSQDAAKGTGKIIGGEPEHTSGSLVMDAIKGTIGSTAAIILGLILIIFAFLLTDTGQKVGKKVVTRGMS